LHSCVVDGPVDYALDRRREAVRQELTLPLRLLAANRDLGLNNYNVAPREKDDAGPLEIRAMRFGRR
jgi:hypothetical protein